MGKVYSTLTGQSHFLHAVHVIGRNKSSDTFIEDKRVSMVHATLRWQSEDWVIHCHGRNGLKLNGQQLSSSTMSKLSAGDLLEFCDEASGHWVVDSVDPPCKLLVPLDGVTEDVVHLEDDFEFLGGGTNPLYLSHSTDDQWVLIQGNTERIVSDKQVVEDNQGRIWRFHHPDVFDQTLDHSSQVLEAGQFPYIKMEFLVSQDEEHVRIIIHVQGKMLDLGERVYHYMLLILARKKLQDANGGPLDDFQGRLSVESLIAMMKVDHNYINQMVFRAKKSITAAYGDPAFSTKVLQRELGGLVLGVDEIVIKKL